MEEVTGKVAKSKYDEDFSKQSLKFEIPKSGHSAFELREAFDC